MKKSSLIGHVAELYRTVSSSPAPPDRIMDTFFRSRKYLGARDRRFIADTLFGMIRHRRAVETLASDRLMEDESLYRCLWYLRLTNAESLESLRGEMALSEETMLSMKAREPLVTQIEESCNAGVRFSFPDWLVEEWIAAYSAEETTALCASLNEQASTTLRVNSLKISVDECQAVLEREGVPTVRTSLSPDGLHLSKRVNLPSLGSYQNGYYEVQDEGSQLLALIADPQPGTTVIDACAGAGGKSLAMAALMGNTGTVAAFDLDANRLASLSKRLPRSGATIVTSRAIHPGEMVNEFRGRANTVLVDAPCSGTGTIRRNPWYKWSVTPERIEAFARMQRSILENNAEYVAPGGRLIYATCSLIRKENQEVVESFLSSRKDFALIDPLPDSLRPRLANGVDNRYFILLPHRHRTDGFFAAAMQRKDP